MLVFLVRLRASELFGTVRPPCKGQVWAERWKKVSGNHKTDVQPGAARMGPKGEEAMSALYGFALQAVDEIARAIAPVKWPEFDV